MIYIMDMSNIVYAASYANPELTVRQFPVAGINSVLKKIAGFSLTDKVLLIFDGVKIIKKELYPEYKANRIPKYTVYAQLELLRDILSKSNIPYLYDENYEADDLIYSACVYLRSLLPYEQITIMSDDRDLSCCVDENISIRNISSNGKSINEVNYSERVVKNKIIPYNTILLYKIFYGDASDNYTGVKLHGISFDQLASEYCNIIKDTLNSLDYSLPLIHCDIDVFNCVIDMMDNLTPEYKDILLKKAKLVFPVRVDIGGKTIKDILDSVGDNNIYQHIYKNLSIFTSATYNKMLRNIMYTTCADRRYGEEDTELLKILALKAQELQDGDFITSKVIYKEHNKGTPKTGLINMELPI